MAEHPRDVDVSQLNKRQIDAGNSESRCSSAGNVVDCALVDSAKHQGLCSGRESNDMSSRAQWICCSPCSGSNNASASSARRSASVSFVWLFDVAGRHGVLEVLLGVLNGVVALLGCKGAGRAGAVAVYGSEASRASKSGSDILRGRW